MRYEGQLNGHPSWNLLEALAGIRQQIGGLEARQEITLEEVRTTRREMREDVVRLHERIDKHVTVRPDRRGWIERSGMSLKEMIGLAIVVLMSLTGTLSSDIIVAWLTH